MNQFKAGDTNAVVLAGMCTALAVVLSMVGFYVPGISLLALLSLPLPIAYMGIREGVKWAVIATSGIMILDSAFFGITTAFFLVVMFGFAGIAMAYCYQKRASALRTFGTIVVVMFFAMLLNLLGTVVMMGMPWDQVYGSTLDQMQGMAKEMSGLMASGDQLDQVNQQTEEMIKTIRKMIPAAMVMAPMVLAWAVMQIEKVVFRRLGLTDFPQFPALECWHFPRWVLLLLLLSVGTQYMPLTEQVKDLAYNVGAVCYFVLWIQGIATLWWLPHIYPVVKRLRLLIVIISIWIPILQLFTVYLGVADMALNYRKKRGYE